jgi:hypothetical protein
VELRRRHRALELQRADDLPEEGIGAEQHVVIEERIVDAHSAFFTQRGAGHLALFLADNQALDRDGRPVAALRDASDGQATRTMIDQADLPAGLRIRPAAGLPDELFGVIGARPWDRDALDRRVLAEMQAGQGRIVDSEPAAAAELLVPRAPVRRAFDAEAWNLDDMSPKSGWQSLYSAARSRQQD